MADSASVFGTSPEFVVDQEHPRPGVVVLSVRGDVDLHVAPDLRERLAVAIDEGARRVVLDLSETTFLDSMALGVLLGAMKRLRAGGGQLGLIVPRPDTRRIFEITLLDRIFPLYPTREQACAALFPAGD